MEAARKFGADVAIQAKEYTPNHLRRAADGRLADFVVICAGTASAITQALESVEWGGTVLFFAPTEPGVSIPISVNDLFWRNEITLTSSYGGSPGDYAAALELIQAGKIRVREMITNRLGLAETGYLCLSLRGAAGDVTISLSKFQIPKSNLQKNPSKCKKSAK